MGTGGSTPSPHQEMPQGASPAGVLSPWLRSCRMTCCLNAPSVGTARVQGSPVASASPPCPPLVPGEGTEAALCGHGAFGDPSAAAPGRILPCGEAAGAGPAPSGICSK